MTAGPNARLLRGLAGGGSVPGSLTALLSAAAVPEVFLLQRWVDLGASLREPLATAIQVRVERWLLNEFALPERLFDKVLEQLYREDRLVTGSLEMGNPRIGLDRLRSPVLAVVNPSARVVPPASILAGIAAMPATCRSVCCATARPIAAPRCSTSARLWPRQHMRRFGRRS